MSTSTPGPASTPPLLPSLLLSPRLSLGVSPGTPGHSRRGPRPSSKLSWRPDNGPLPGPGTPNPERGPSTPRVKAEDMFGHEPYDDDDEAESRNRRPRGGGGAAGSEGGGRREAERGGGRGGEEAKPPQPAGTWSKDDSLAELNRRFFAAEPKEGKLGVGEEGTPWSITSLLPPEREKRRPKKAATAATTTSTTTPVKGVLSGSKSHGKLPFGSPSDSSSTSSLSSPSSFAAASTSPFPKPSHNVPIPVPSASDPDSLMSDFHAASDFLDSYHFVSQMLHRTTNVSGAVPNGQPHSFSSGSSLDQITPLSTNKEMNSVILSLKALSRQFEDIVHSVSDHRKELGRSIRLTHTTYVRLFERMLFIVLKLQRKREKALEEELKDLRGSVGDLVYQNELLQAQLLKLGDQNGALVGLNKSLRAERDALKNECDDLAKFESLYHRNVADAQEQLEGAEREREQLARRLKAEEESMLKRFKDAEAELERERRHYFEELQKAAREKERLAKKPLITVSSVVHEAKKVGLIPKPPPPAPEKPPVETAVGFSQTEVNDDGLWQKQDGWVINVTEDVLARALWRRSLRYAACPSCRGAGEFMRSVIDDARDPAKKAAAKEAALEIEEEGEEEGGGDDMDLAEREEKPVSKTRGRRSGLDPDWMLPDEIVQFLCNLPKTALAVEPRPLAWLAREMNGILEEKAKADREDEHEGVQLQPMNEFLMELLLKRYGMRRLAELNLYIFIVTIKEYYKTNSLAHLFARFMGLIDETRGHKKKEPEKPKKIEDEAMAHEMKMSNRPLDTHFLSAFLWTRARLFKEYTGKAVYGSDIRASGGDGSLEGVPLHVIVEGGTEFWIPLDRAVGVVRLVLNFLAPRKLATYSRQIEAGAHLLFRNGRVSNPDGSRMIIRSMMRQSMLKKQVKKEGDAPEEPIKDDCQIVINVYATLELIMEILYIRVQHMEDQLKRYFIEGDDNGDGVLSFGEFDALLKRIAPHFSDRKILRMFREALTCGEESNFAIEKGVFADVCKRHGLVRLVDTRSLEAEEAQKVKEAEAVSKEAEKRKLHRTDEAANEQDAEEDDDEEA